MGSTDRARSDETKSPATSRAMSAERRARWKARSSASKRLDSRKWPNTPTRKVLRRHTEFGAPADHFRTRRKIGGQLEQMRDFVDRRAAHVLVHQGRRARVVHDHRPRPLRHALDHRIAEVFRIGGRTRAPPPQLARQVFAPVAIVIDELGDIFLFVLAAQEEMMQHRVVQHRHAGRFERVPVDFAMQWVIAEMIERDIGVARVHLHRTQRR